MLGLNDSHLSPTPLIQTPGEPGLKTEIVDMQAMCSGENWATEDPLGIGGLLSDAYRLVQLIDTHQLHETTRLESLLHDVEISLQAFVNNNQLNLPAEATFDYFFIQYCSSDN
jgi:hypothetical protein